MRVSHVSSKETAITLWKAKRRWRRARLVSHWGAAGKSVYGLPNVDYTER
jgi:hypothetical protein